MSRATLSAQINSFITWGKYEDLHIFLADSSNYSMQPNWKNTPVCHLVIQSFAYSEAQTQNLIHVAHQQGFNLNVKFYVQAKINEFPLLNFVMAHKSWSSKFREKLVHQLVDYGVDVNASDSYRRTALMECAEFMEGESAIEVMQFLLERGANPNVFEVKGKSVLRIVAVKNKPALCKILLEYGVDESAKNKIWKHRIIDELIFLSNKEKIVAENIIPVWARHSKMGLPNYLENKPDELLISETVNEFNVNMTRALLMHMSDINAKHKIKSSPLMILFHRRHFYSPAPPAKREKFRGFNVELENLVLLALNRGASVKTKDRYGLTPLFLAVMNNMPEAVYAILCRYDKNINYICDNPSMHKRYRVTPFQYNLREGLEDENRLRIAGMLWYHGAFLNFDTFRFPTTPRDRFFLDSIDQNFLVHMLKQRDNWMDEYHTQAQESTDPRLSEKEVLARRQVYDNKDLREMIKNFM